MAFDPCGMEKSGDLPWPMFQLMPDDMEGGPRHTREEEMKAPRPVATFSGRKKLCSAWFQYKNHSKELQWEGPEGGNALIRTVRKAFDVSDEKLVYLIDPRSRDVVDIDTELPEHVDYEVRIEPEDAGPLDIVPCLLNLCSFRYAARAELADDDSLSRRSLLVGPFHSDAVPSSPRKGT